MSDSEELVVSQKTWYRSMDSIEKDGFREGFEAGRNKSFQDGFNVGFKSGFELHFEQALLDAKKQIMETSPVINERPKDKCVICSEENTDEIMQLPLEAIVEKQKYSFAQSS